MTRLDALNAVAFALALGLASWGAGAPGALPADPHRDPAPPPPLEIGRGPDGQPTLRDASGQAVPLLPYRRIASASLLSDRVLADLCEPDRIVAFTRYAARTPSGHRYAGKPTISARDDVERILALKPDLLITSDLVDVQLAARLRAEGVRVFDLGQMRGLDTLLPAIRAIGHLIGAPERADAYARSLARRMQSVAAGDPRAGRTRAVYLSVYGTRLFGAGDRTSYHDVLVHAGLRNAAAEHGLSGWPELTSEQVLAIDPDAIVTRAGMVAVLCRHPGLAQLRPCRGAGRLIELDGALLEDPGPGMLEATEALHAAFVEE